MARPEGLEGMAVAPGQELLHLADTSQLWLRVQVFEGELSSVKVGSRAEIALTYFAEEPLTGRVRFVEPEIAEETRTASVTIQVPNRRGRLQPGMFATVHFAPLTAHAAIAVPSDAVIRTGNCALVLKEDRRTGITDCRREMATVELRIKSDMVLYTVNKNRVAMIALDAPLQGKTMPIRLGKHHKVPSVGENIPGVESTGFYGAISSLKILRQ